MKALLLTMSVGALSLLAAGCASGRAGGGSGVELARFHLGEPIARAQIAIEAFDEGDERRPEYPLYAAALERELTRLGWTVVRTLGQSEQVALIDVEQGSGNRIAALSGARIGRGRSASTAASSDATITATLLEVGIKRRSDGTLFWEGRAVGQARTGSEAAAPGPAADRLAAALFRDFPGESGRIISVR